MVVAVLADDAELYKERLKVSPADRERRMKVCALRRGPQPSLSLREVAR